MNYGRGFPLPHFGNKDSFPPENGIPPETGITHTAGSWTAAVLGGQIPATMRPTPANDGITHQTESESWNGIASHTNSYTPINQSYSNHIVQNTNRSWTPVTPSKPNLQRSNINQVENENWGDLIGMYQGLLQKETINLNEVAQNLNPTMVNNNENQNRILNSTPVQNVNRGSNHVPYYSMEDPANWNNSLLGAIFRPNKSPINGSFNSPMQNGSNSGNQQSHMLTPNKPVGSSNQLPIDGFPIPYRPYYNLNSPPRSEQDAASSGITGSFPFTPITPHSQRKQTESQWGPTKNTHESQSQSQRNEDNDLLQNINDSTSSAVSTTQKEHLVLEEGDELGIDLNKTPQQKTPARRKKHRPKVIREVKAKKTQTPSKDPKKTQTPSKDPKNVNSNETPVKRKYVRKIANNVSEGQQISPNGVKGKRKYVRKKNVENLEKKAEETNIPIVETPAKSCKKQLNFDETPAKSCKKQLNFDLECVAVDESQTEGSQHGQNGQQGISINLNVNPQDMEQERGTNHILERSARKVQQNNTYTSINSSTQQDSSMTHFQNGLTHNPAHNPAHNMAQHMSTPIAKAGDHALNVLARNLTIRNSGNVQMNNLRNGYDPTGQTTHGQTGHGSINIPNTHGQTGHGPINIDERRGVKRPSFEQINPRNLNAMDSILMYQKLLMGSSNSNDLANILENHKKSKLQNDPQTFVSNSRGESRQTNNVYGNVSALELLNSCHKKVNPSYQVSGSRYQQQMMAANANTTQNNLQKLPESSGMQPMIERSNKGNGVNNVTAMISWNKPPATPPKDYGRSAIVPYPATLLDKKKKTPTPRKGGPRKQKVGISIEDITCMLEGLCIYDENMKVRNALVPYKNNSNAIIPFEPIKKRKPRPKVDLDPESDRLWRLLMGKEGSEADEKLDKDKEKWWENERRVFRGRADSFIARMHLVQGDRRFSRWKGSVVDSVIGVFLTQNVSDHLSSSAFMSLAAKFAFKSTNTNETQSQSQNRACVVVEEPIEPIDTILPNKNINCNNNQSSFASCESSENTINNNHISSTKYEANNVILSQDSLDSSTIQTIDEIRSSSGSNSEAEDQTIGFESTRKSQSQPEKVNIFKELFTTNASQYIHQIPKTPSSNIQNPINNKVNNFQFDFLENNNLKTPENRAHKQDSCSVVDKETYVAEANSKERISGPEVNISKGKKVISEDEKKKAFDWDSLRRNVFMKCEKQERSKDAKDSLDYEALRSAHVNEISDAIRERGMNNMLADRIQDFLNRLVRDHGSIDLEWLRDAPPDKAKDYLLSIRGLGLKSVECVRLLTLHHLAFPVDTNVGRIAVRLGWVPLQPLPESLQLHLLEMYPVLESIQKYLWPRLCKLDQRTLYELHYQMITFGKVFCTKSKPNCNACPMRAECRHFASAFASARLSLPGPEEKSMIPSNAQNAPNPPNTPNAKDRFPPMLNIQMQLPPSENNLNNKDSNFIRKQCEPIIEEPTTPEPETAELSLSDIEDQYYDDNDNDEIPTIKLDMNEFTTNLQKSMEIQGDMSKALVMLNPQAASIPTPKLKNVSRLRTEHQVYELPDSHPILEGLDKREPDDPSPYLLAIWTPGETANSMQPPEKGCQAQESGILCERTTCCTCNCIKEANSQVVRGTILMPCRTAMRGSFPLNGTYFQVNEMFADHASSLKPIDVPRAWIWNLPRRTVYFGTSVSTIFKGLTTQEIQQCFWRGFVCVRGFDQKLRAPRPLMARLHFPASKLVKTKNDNTK